MFAAVSASRWRISLTRSSVCPSSFQSSPDSPRSPYESATTCASSLLAIAPAARQTKSAECALTTRSFLGIRQHSGVRHRHRADLVVREARLEQLVGEQRDPVLYGRVCRLAEVRRDDVVLGARRADRLERR